MSQKLIIYLLTYYAQQIVSEKKNTVILIVTHMYIKFLQTG